MNSKAEKKDFMKKICVLIDTREQKNKHITDVLDSFGVMRESRKLDYGDYSFSVDGRDFSSVCVIERKADINELYGNVVNGRERIEKELDTASKNANQLIFLIEKLENWDSMKAYMISDEDMVKFGRKVKNIGETCYSTMQAWRCGNRYNFTVEFVPDNSQTAVKIIELFYWYYHNYRKLTSARKNNE